jgi:hypothetical protein
MEFSVVLEHVVISLVPSLVGIVVGGSLGALCAFSSHLLFTWKPWLLKPAAILPWRTVIAGLLLVIWSPFMVIRFGSGPIAGALIVGLVIALLSVDGALIVLFESWHPSPMPAVLVAGIRALLIIGIVVAVGVGYLGGGGIGSFIMAQEGIARQEAARTGWKILIALIFALDELFGLIQFVVCNVFESRKVSDEVRKSWQG